MEEKPIQESNMVKCKVCAEIKRRILVGKYDAKNKRWENELGQMWNGLVCPPCHKGNMREREKQRRLRDKRRYERVVRNAKKG